MRHERETDRAGNVNVIRVEDYTGKVTCQGLTFDSVNSARHWVKKVGHYGYEVRKNRK